MARWPYSTRLLTIGVIRKGSLHIGGVLLFERTGAFARAAKLGVDLVCKGVLLGNTLLGKFFFGRWADTENSAFTSPRASQNKNDTYFGRMCGLGLRFRLVLSILSVHARGAP